MTSNDARKTLDRLLGEVRTLRDEIKVQIHLGSMEAKDAFAKLEPKLREVERDIQEAGETARAKLHERLEDLRTALQKAGGHLI